MSELREEVPLFSAAQPDAGILGSGRVWGLLGRGRDLGEIRTWSHSTGHSGQRRIRRPEPAHAVTE